MIREEETDKFLILLRLFSLFLLESSRSRNFLFSQDTFVTPYKKSPSVFLRRRSIIMSLHLLLFREQEEEQEREAGVEVLS